MLSHSSFLGKIILGIKASSSENSSSLVLPESCRLVDCVDRKSRGKGGAKVAKRAISVNEKQRIALRIKLEPGHTPEGEVEKIYLVCYLIWRDKRNLPDVGTKRVYQGNCSGGNKGFLQNHSGWAIQDFTAF